MEINKFLDELMSFKDSTVHCYNLDILQSVINTVKDDFYDISIYYAVKANSDTKVLNTFKKNAVGVDCASYEEYCIAKEIGFKKISCTGPGFKLNEIIQIIEDNNNFDFENLNQLQQYIMNSNIQKRLSGNMGVRLLFENSNFGLAINDIMQFNTLIDFQRLHVHYGEKTYRNLKDCLDYLYSLLRDTDIFKSINAINLGGSFDNIYSKNDQKNVADLIREFKKKCEKLLHKKIEIIIEPGDLLVRIIGYYKTNIISVSSNKVVINSSILNFCPWYGRKIYLGSKSNETKVKIIGNSCFENDYFGEFFSKDKLTDKDVAIIYPTGSYNFNMNKYIHERKSIKSI